MPPTTSDRLDAIEYLLFSHVLTLEKLDPGSARATLSQAESFADVAQKNGQAGVARQLRGLMDTIRVSADLPVND